MRVKVKGFVEFVRVNSGEGPGCSQVGTVRFCAPELLFRPDLIGEECEGIHEVLAFAIQKSDLDLRRTLYSNIVLSGGSTLFKGSILASLDTFKKMWISKKQYEEDGARAIHRKTF
ncbi:hypothetical protein AAFF_G00381810 [Aldrovandia affinis]|uniref:Uncharacterized protein n=1 Tax=Aldrovandia affinis TaxID=143900 RepID=A0AAD7X1N5_9TELE|nr:hypothetical protein AAFF_G00381810 [Aldrovandia affinis]